VTDVSDSVVSIAECGTILFQATNMIFKTFLELSLADIDVAQTIEHLPGSVEGISSRFLLARTVKLLLT
jgi:hypothetical protein